MNRIAAVTILAFIVACACPIRNVYSQIYDVSLAERVMSSEVIIEGKITERQCFRAGDRGLIYTTWLIDVAKVFKGTVNTDEVWIITEGGTVGDEELIVRPCMFLSERIEGLFMLRQKQIALPATIQPQLPGFEPVTRVQGFIQYDRVIGSANDIFRVFNSIEQQLYPAITELTGREVERRRADSGANGFKKSGNGGPAILATISSFSPTTIRAGVDDVLVINGSGFGSSFSGSANVQFTNHYGGVSAGVEGGHVHSWSDSQIRVVVPSSAATGSFRVTSTSGAQVTSSSQLSVPFSVINAYSGSTSPIDLYNDNGAGGFTFTMNSSFAANTEAKNAFFRAVQTWRCGTYVDFAIDPYNTSSSCHAVDGVNMVSFDHNCTLGSGVLGVTYLMRVTCLAGAYIWRWNEFDIVISSSSSIYIGSGTTPSGSYDFETIMLHELGHAVSLEHVRPSGHLMYFAASKGQMIRTLNPTSAQAGGMWVVNRSMNHNGCGGTGLIPLNASNCALTTGPPPIANFTANPGYGCAPLTVTFYDASVNSPTSWEWDVNNDGINDYFTSNPTHTYTQKGLYSVRLRVSSSNGSDTEIRTNMINVREQPRANAGPDRAVCQSGAMQIGGLASGGTPPYTYSWQPAEGLSDPYAPVPLASPVATTRYIVTVSDIYGCTAADSVLITVRPSPSVDAGPDRTLGAGQTGTIGGYASGGQPPYAYSWYPTTGLDASNVPMPNVTPQATTLYTVTVTDALGCSSTDEVVVVVGGPIPEISSSGQTTFCEGESVILTASQGFTSYVWYPGGERTQSITVKKGGTYYVTATDAGGIALRSSSIVIQVYQRPAAVISPSGTVQICQGKSVTLSVTGDYPTYKWSNGAVTRSIIIDKSGSFSAIVTNAQGCVDTSETVTVQVISTTVAVQPSGPIRLCDGESVELDAGEGFSTYTWSTGQRTRKIVARTAGRYTVNVTTSSGCQGSGSVEVDVVSKPRISPPGPILLCKGSRIVLDAGAGFTSYHWSTGESSQRITVSTAGAYFVQARAGGCTVISDTVRVTDVPVLAPTIRALGPTIFCQGDSVTLTAPDGYSMYLWTNGESGKSTVVTTSGVYAVSVVDSAGCTGVSQPIPVLVHPAPLPPVIGNDTTLCEGDSLVLYAGSGHHSYRWSDGSSLSTLTVRRTGAYSVEVTNGNGCSARSGQRKIDFESRPETPTIERVGTVLLSSKAEYYQWYRNGVPIAGATDQFYAVVEGGAYTVEVRSERDGCGAMSLPLDYTLGVAAAPDAPDISLYPDPSDGRFTVLVPMHGLGWVRMRIINTLGITIHEREYLSDTRELRIPVDVSSAATGVYIVYLAIEGHGIVRKMLKK